MNSSIWISMTLAFFCIVTYQGGNCHEMLSEDIDSEKEAKISEPKKSDTESEKAPKADDIDPEGKLLGLVDFILTPNRWARNTIRWVLDGVIFFGVLVQADTLLRAAVDAKMEKEEEEALRAVPPSRYQQHLARRDYNPALPQYVTEQNQIRNVYDRGEVGSFLAKQSHPKARKDYKIYQRDYRNFMKKKPRKNQLSRSGPVGFEEKLEDLQGRTCIKKGLCNIVKLSNVSAPSRKIISQLRRSPSFKYPQDIVNPPKDCDKVFSECSQTSEEILRVLF